jgi:hypothetical protein
MAVFEKHAADTTMASTHFVIPADFDGDGDLDLVATSEGTNSVAWYEHDGRLNFTKRVLDANLDSAYPASVADLDRDGDPDILAAGYRADRYVWYQNNGSAGFAIREVDVKNGPHSIIASDFDGFLRISTATATLTS